MSGGERFTTLVRGVHGSWPQPPAVWSYSSLREAEECPRRWMLTRAEYPDIWASSGYPPRPILPALVGEAVHRILELVLLSLRDHGCEVLAAPCGVAVLKDLGGYTKLAERAVDELLTVLDSNPRAKDRLPEFRSALSARVPEMRRRVQGILARTSLRPSLVRRDASIEPGVRMPLGEGSHPEVELRAAELGFVGRVDLLTIHSGACTVTDYKTGAPDPHHADQLRTYALLWSRDRDLNPNEIPVQQLVVSYPTHEEPVDAPTERELAVLAQRLVDRTQGAVQELGVQPPPARPALEMCRRCSVRHLCEAYWSGPAGVTPSRQPLNELSFIDCQLVVGRRNGPRSWIVTLEPSQQSGLLRTLTETPPFVPGDHVRLLDVAYVPDEESGRSILTVTGATEIHVLDMLSSASPSS